MAGKVVITEDISEMCIDINDKDFSLLCIRREEDLQNLEVFYKIDRVNKYFLIEEEGEELILESYLKMHNIDFDEYYTKECDPDEIKDFG